MIKSKYIADIVHLLIDADDVELKIRQQAELISDTDYNYTGYGLFVTFTSPESIKNYRIEKDDLLLLGVKINSEESNIDAEAILFFKAGIIDYLEIWCNTDNYPKHDLSNYTLTQAWNDSPGKQLSAE